MKNLLAENRTIFLDGSMGAVLLKNGVESTKIKDVCIHSPELVERIHKDYVDAGCDIILTSTFNVSPTEKDETNRAILDAGLSVARKAVAETNCKVALGFGPTGKIYYPYSKETIEVAYDFYAPLIRDFSHRADLIIFETMADITELKGAIKACEDFSSVPVFISMTFTKKERTWIGARLKEYIDVINSASNVIAVGLNCTLTPKEMVPLLQKLKEAVSLPIFAEPNMGSPYVDENGQTAYKMTSDEFVEDMMELHNIGINILGGCCGSDAECIRKLKEKIENL